MTSGARSDMFARLRGRVLALLPGTEERRLMTEACAQAWRDQNEAAVATATATPSTRLWIALGDSTSQGIGASTYDNGWVGQVLAELRAQDPAWVVVNLSVSGARMVDVVEQQLPQMAGLPAPALVTCAVGANDMFRGRRGTTLPMVRRLLDALPADTVVATIPRGIRQRLAAEVNDAIRAGAAERGFPLADVWAHTGAPWTGKYASDGFHPNDVGYREWTDAFRPALDEAVDR